MTIAYLKVAGFLVDKIHLPEGFEIIDCFPGDDRLLGQAGIFKLKISGLFPEEIPDGSDVCAKIFTLFPGAPEGKFGFQWQRPSDWKEVGPMYFIDRFDPTQPKETKNQ